MVQAQIDMRRCAFGQQHPHDLPCRAIAEQLAERLFMEGDAVLADQRDEIVLRVAGEGGAREMRIGRQEAIRHAAGVGEVAAPATADQDLLPRRLRMIQQQHALAPLARAQGAHQPGGAGAEDDDVEIPHDAQAASARPAMSRPTASATRIPSTPAEKMPPAYPAPSPAG
jgi:hypothetical protein